MIVGVMRMLLATAIVVCCEAVDEYLGGRCKRRADERRHDPQQGF